MSKLIERISKISLLVLGLISLLLVVLIYVGGNGESVTVGEEVLTVPKFTDALINWMYFLLVLTLLITIGLTIFGFVKSLVANPISALKGLIPIGLFVAVFAIAWLFGSPDKVSIIGYEGTDNVGFWAQFTDMLVYSIYALFIGLAITIVGAGVYRSTK